MWIRMLLMIGVSSTCFSLPCFTQSNDLNHLSIWALTPSLSNLAEPDYLKSSTKTPEEIKTILQKEAQSLSTPVINKVIATVACSSSLNLDHHNILTVIDYSLPSSEKRLWIFDLKQEKLLFHTYVSHGIKSGTLFTTNFSNKYDSKSSSLGVYKTEKSYYGRDGISLRLDGLDRGFNDNASNRSIVMHGGWYVEENFIKKYGRPGRSWGCPAVPVDMAKPIIDTIKDQSLLVVYYPSDDWFLKSRFLHCNQIATANPSHSVVWQGLTRIKSLVTKAESFNYTELRDDILFVDLNKKSKHEDREAALVMPADSYQRIFNSNPPLGRMLRRRSNNNEYIALSPEEFKILAKQSDKSNLNDLYFVVPDIKMIRGYYETQMKLINMGIIKDISFDKDDYNVLFDGQRSVHLKRTARFIRWVGL